MSTSAPSATRPSALTAVSLALLLSAIAGCGGGSNGDSGSSSGKDASSSTRGQASASAGAQQSTNWSGYVRTGALQSFGKVSGTWTVPAVQCSGNGATASATWVGIGGGTATDPTLIQAGTTQDCNGGGASYSAWWELIPAPSIPAGGLLSAQSFEVQPGDQITVTIDSSILVVWSITIKNASRGWTFNTTLPYVAAGATVEWIEEAPLGFGTGGAGQTTLSNFGRVNFTSVTANGANPHLSSQERVVMVDANGGVIANPSPPAASGDAFGICFGAAACP